MAGYRATKSGLAAETQQKVASKYEPELAQQCLEWIGEATGAASDPNVPSFSTSGDMDNFHSQLKDGYLLAKLANKYGGNIKNAKPQKLAFKQMETIGLAIDAFKKLGVPDTEACATVDLYESVNLHQVTITLQSLARKLGAFGPKEATENKRNFSEEQMKAGQNVIGLQMGTNKGANQSGMNIGNTRHIVD